MKIILTIGVFIGTTLLLFGFLTKDIIYLTSGGFLIIGNQMNTLIYFIKKQHDQ